MAVHPDPLPALYCCSSAGNGRGAMPFLMSFALEHEIVTFAWIDNASVQFPLNIYATNGSKQYPSSCRHTAYISQARIKGSCTASASSREAYSDRSLRAAAARSAKSPT